MQFKVDISDLLDSFGNAHGLDWLEEFYVNNDSKLSEMF